MSAGLQTTQYLYHGDDLRIEPTVIFAGSEGAFYTIDLVSEAVRLSVFCKLDKAAKMSEKLRILADAIDELDSGLQSPSDEVSL